MKGFKAKGKRLTTYAVAEIRELEPLRREEDETAEGETPTDETNPENRVDTPEDNPSGQMSLF